MGSKLSSIESTMGARSVLEVWEFTQKSLILALSSRQRYHCSWFHYIISLFYWSISINVEIVLILYGWRENIDYLIRRHQPKSRMTRSILWFFMINSSFPEKRIVDLDDLRWLMIEMMKFLNRTDLRGAWTGGKVGPFWNFGNFRHRVG